MRRCISHDCDDSCRTTLKRGHDVSTDTTATMRSARHWIVDTMSPRARLRQRTARNIETWKRCHHAITTAHRYPMTHAIHIDACKRTKRGLACRIAACKSPPLRKQRCASQHVAEAATSGVMRCGTTPRGAARRDRLSRVRHKIVSTPVSIYFPAAPSSSLRWPGTASKVARSRAWGRTSRTGLGANTAAQNTSLVRGAVGATFQLGAGFPC
jgi:hypothetical protein